jgi:hypothetical protein
MYAVRFDLMSFEESIQKIIRFCSFHKLTSNHIQKYLFFSGFRFFLSVCNFYLNHFEFEHPLCTIEHN